MPLKHVKKVVFSRFFEALGAQGTVNKPMFSAPRKPKTTVFTMFCATGSKTTLFAVCLLWWLFKMKYIPNAVGQQLRSQIAQTQSNSRLVSVLQWHSVALLASFLRTDKKQRPCCDAFPPAVGRGRRNLFKTVASSFGGHMRNSKRHATEGRKRSAATDFQCLIAF